jgi:glycosyltransferase involved in cell wall biosynthesis
MEYKMPNTPPNFYDFSNLKVAICHEWLDNVGGGEKVLFQVASLFPNVTIFSLWGDQAIAREYNLKLVESFIRFLPSRLRRTLGIPLMPLAWGSFSKKLRTFDLVITSSWAFAHACGRSSQVSVNYIHTPGRYWWNPDIDTRTTIKLPRTLTVALQKIDRYLAKEHGINVANSRTTSDRIQFSWNQESKIVHPPVDLTYYNFERIPEMDRGQYLLGVGRFVPYKNLEFIIELGEFLNVPVVIAGHGPLYANLLKRAAQSTVDVSIQNSPSDEEIRNLYLTASYLIYPVIEDFGIVPVEAMGCGLQVIGLSSGGLTETVIEGVSGSLVEEMNVEEFASALKNLPRRSSEEIRDCVEKFSQQAFTKKIVEIIQESINASS